MKLSRNALVVFLIVLAFSFWGCTAGRMYEIGPESHFVFPNSNVRMLGPVSYTHKSPKSVGFPEMLMTGKEELDFYNAALTQVPGADLITDYVRITEFKVIPFPYLPISWTEITIQGTAAKMTVGEQDLEGGQRAGRPAAKAPAEKGMGEAREISKAAEAESEK